MFDPIVNDGRLRPHNLFAFCQRSLWDFVDDALPLPLLLQRREGAPSPFSRPVPFGFDGGAYLGRFMGLDRHYWRFAYGGLGAR